jgi:hypothetical protein
MPWPFYAGKLNSMQTRQRAIVGNIGLVVGAVLCYLKGYSLQIVVFPESLA